MGAIAEGWQELGLAAAVAVGVIAVVGACYLGMEYRRYGRLGAWSGKVTHAVPIVAAAGVGLVVWPAGGCVGESGGLVPTLLLVSLLAVAGFLSWHRYRRGPLLTVAGGAAVGLAGAMARAELASQCAGTVTSPDLGTLIIGVLGGGVGAGVGWLVARFTNHLLPRGWPGALPDWGSPQLSRRLLAVGIDFGLWWSLATLLAAGLAATGVDPGPRGLFAFLGVAVLLGLLFPLLTTSRATPGRAATSLALQVAGETAPRWRVALRCVSYYGPIVAMFGLGLPLWSLVVLALHAAPALVHPQRAGLFDLVSGVRVTTRFTIDGRPPIRMVRLRTPAADQPAAVQGT